VSTSFLANFLFVSVFPLLTAVEFIARISFFPTRGAFPNHCFFPNDEFVLGWAEIKVGIPFAIPAIQAGHPFKPPK